MSEERVFRGIWIPAKVWLDERLSALDKIILAEIDSLDNSERGCYATNEHIAQFCQCGTTTVSVSISKLIKLGYIELKSFDGRTRFLKSCLSKIERPLSENEGEPFKNCKAAIQNLKESNINSNIDRNIESNNTLSARARFVKPSVEEVAAYIAEKGYTVDAEEFVDFYESKGWMIGKNPMKDWKAAVRTWAAKRKNEQKKEPVKSTLPSWN